MGKIKINTSQNVEIEYEAASIGDRIGAYMIDWAIYFAYYILVFSALAQFEEILPTWVWVVLSILPVFFYQVCCEIFLNGQSIGKRQMHIQVISVDGKEAGLHQYLLRWISRMVDMSFFAPGLVAIAVIILTGKGQRLGDMLAGTAVVRLRMRHAATLRRWRKFDEGYRPVFPGALRLSLQDVQIIERVIFAQDKILDRGLLLQTVAKVKELIQAETELPPVAFLKTVVKDYYHLHLTTESIFAK